MNIFSIHRQPLTLMVAAFLMVLLSISPAQAQTDGLQAGRFGLGMRNAANFWGENQMRGLGAGGQFKLAFGPRVNTDWFADIIQSRGEHNSFRNDYHIGWAVQFALPKAGFQYHKLVPYLLAGQCFDLTRVGVRNGSTTPYIFSAAVQGGAGLSWFVHRSLELNLQAQYMMHLTKHVHLDFDEAGLATTEIAPGPSPEGHLLGTLSFTFYFLQIWNR